MYTPWGSSQEQQTIAPGLVSVSTAGHGGYHVSEDRWQEIERMFPEFKSWTGRHWLEEDCDWALAPLTWPDLFNAQQIFNALRTARTRSDKCITERWLLSTHGRTVTVIADAYAAKVAGCWEVGGLWAPVTGHPKAWGSIVSRETDGSRERRRVVFASYPLQQFYTDTELVAATIQESSPE